MGRSGCPTKGGNFFRQGVSLQGKKFELSFFVEHHSAKKLSPPVPWSQTIYRTCISNNFRQVLSNICLRRAFSITQPWLIWKSLLGLNPLMQNNVQQDYLPKKYPIISLNIFGKPWGWERILPKLTYLFRYQKCIFFPMK